MENFYYKQKNRLMIRVRVNPGSVENRIVGPVNGELVIKIRKQPQKGRANRELLVFLARILGISRSEIFLVSGAASRHKVLSVAAETLSFFKGLS